MGLDHSKLAALPESMRTALAKGPTSPEWKDAVRGVPAEDLRAAALAMKDAATDAPSVRREKAFAAKGEPFFHHGDLVVDGNLSVSVPFFVTGDVTVSGVFMDCGPDSKVGIAGNVRAAHLHTDGEFGCGDVECPDGVVYGHYNDNSLFARTIRARVVIGDEHDIQADKVVAPTYFDLDAYRQGHPENVKKKLRGIFVDGVFDEEGSLDHHKLFGELVDGKPVFHVSTSTTPAGAKAVPTKKTAAAKPEAKKAAPTKPASKKAAAKTKPAPKKKAAVKMPAAKKKPAAKMASARAVAKKAPAKAVAKKPAAKTSAKRSR